MAEILPGVHLVDGIDPGTHVYLLKDKGATWTLIDTGEPGSDTATAAYLKSQRIEPTAVKKILITHLHRDHTGALRKTAQLTKARTFAHWLDAAFIAQRPAYDGPGNPPVEAVNVDETLKDGDSLDAAGGLIAYHTPGHTPGHTAFYQPERRLLFSGDLFFGAGSKAILTTKEYTQHLQSAIVSARRMAQLSIDSLLSYHGGPFLKNGGEQVRAVAQSL